MVDLQQKLMSQKEVAEAFGQAMAEDKPISLACLGDVEMYLIAYQKIPVFDQGLAPGLLKYIENQALKDEILNGVLQSDIIGIFRPKWQQTIQFFEHFAVPTEHLCDSYIGKGLHFSGLLYKILQNKRVFLVGNTVDNMLPVLEKFQIELAGKTKVNSFQDIPRVKECLSQADFDLALISAGMPSLILAPWVTRNLKRCALDFGNTVKFVKDTLDYIGAARNDFNVFDPEARTNFRFLPKELDDLANRKETLP